MPRHITDHDVRRWSHGEVKRAETFARDRSPAVHGLECERIFGPVRDHACRCGRYVGRRFEREVCVDCGVEVIAADGRASRIGHIVLATPISHGRSSSSLHEVLPVLPPALRPSTPDHLHPVTRLYQSILLACDADTLQRLVDRVLVELRTAELDHVQAHLAGFARGERLEQDPTVTLAFRRASLDPRALGPDDEVKDASAVPPELQALASKLISSLSSGRRD